MLGNIDINTLNRLNTRVNYVEAKLFFNSELYFKLYPDLKTSGIKTPAAAYNHYLNNGIKENRIGTLYDFYSRYPNFNLSYYTKKYPYVPRAEIDAIVYYYLVGRFNNQQTTDNYILTENTVVFDSNLVINGDLTIKGNLNTSVDLGNVTLLLEISDKLSTLSQKINYLGDNVEFYGDITIHGNIINDEFEDVRELLLGLTEYVDVANSTIYIANLEVSGFINGVDFQSTLTKLDTLSTKLSYDSSNVTINSNLIIDGDLVVNNIKSSLIDFTQINSTLEKLESNISTLENSFQQLTLLADSSFLSNVDLLLTKIKLNTENVTIDSQVVIKEDLYISGMIVSNEINDIIEDIEYIHSNIDELQSSIKSLTNIDPTTLSELSNISSDIKDFKTYFDLSQNTITVSKDFTIEGNLTVGQFNFTDIVSDIQDLLDHKTTVESNLDINSSNVVVKNDLVIKGNLISTITDNIKSELDELKANVNNTFVFNLPSELTISPTKVTFGDKIVVSNIDCPIISSLQSSVSSLLSSYQSLNLPSSELLISLASLSNNLTFTSSNIQIKKDLIVTGSINGVNLSQLASDVSTLKSIDFSNITSDLVVTGNINGVNLSQLASDVSTLKNKDYSNITSDLTVNGKVNGVNLTDYKNNFYFTSTLVGINSNLIVTGNINNVDIEELYNTVSMIKSNICQQETLVDELGVCFNEHREEIEIIYNDLCNLRTTISLDNGFTVKTDLNLLGNINGIKLSDLTNNISVLKGNISSLEGRTSTVESKQTNFESRVSSVESNITSVRSSLSVINTIVYKLTTTFTTSTNTTIIPIDTVHYGSMSGISINNGIVTITTPGLYNVQWVVTQFSNNIGHHYFEILCDFKQYSGIGLAKTLENVNQTSTGRSSSTMLDLTTLTSFTTFALYCTSTNSMLNVQINSNCAYLYITRIL